jgi:hypothetical protein
MRTLKRGGGLDTYLVFVFGVCEVWTTINPDSDAD